MTPSLALPQSMNSAARTTCAPGRGSRQGRPVDPALDRAAQQPVPGRVELDLVDPVAEPVVRAQDRHVALGPPAVLERLDAAGDGAGLAARSTPQPPPSRSSASRSARSTSNRLTGCSGGGWLRTSRAGSVTSTVAMWLRIHMVPEASGCQSRRRGRPRIRSRPVRFTSLGRMGILGRACTLALGALTGLSSRARADPRSARPRRTRAVASTSPSATAQREVLAKAAAERDRAAIPARTEHAGGAAADDASSSAHSAPPVPVRRLPPSSSSSTSSGTSRSASSSTKPSDEPPSPMSSRSDRSGSMPAEAGQRLAVGEPELGREVVVVEQADLVDPAGQRLGGLDLDPAIALEPGRGRDQLADDHVLLEPVEAVDLALERRVGQHLGRLLEGGRRQERIGVQRRLGDPEDDLLGLGRLAAGVDHRLVDRGRTPGGRRTAPAAGRCRPSGRPAPSSSSGGRSARCACR